MAKRKPKSLPAASPPAASPDPASGVPDLFYIHADLRPLAVPIGEVLLDPKNAREHSNANLQAIARSLQEFGQVKPIIVNGHNNQIEAGNGTYLAAQTLGWTHIAILRVEHDAAAQRGFSIADNRTAELADWNDLILAEALNQIQEESPDLYTELLLSEISAAADNGVIVPDESPLPEIQETIHHSCVMPYTDEDIPALKTFLGVKDLPTALGKAINERIKAIVACPEDPQPRRKKTTRRKAPAG